VNIFTLCVPKDHMIRSLGTNLKQLIYVHLQKTIVLQETRLQVCLFFTTYLSEISLKHTLPTEPAIERADTWIKVTTNSNSVHANKDASTTGTSREDPERERENIEQRNK
jgi:hypothetical protein